MNSKKFGYVRVSSKDHGIKLAAEKSINYIIGGINKMIKTINKIPGVNIPIVPKVDWSQANTRPPKIAYESIKLKQVQNRPYLRFN